MRTSLLLTFIALLVMYSLGLGLELGELVCSAALALVLGRSQAASRGGGACKYGRMSAALLEALMDMALLRSANPRGEREGDWGWDTGEVLLPKVEPPPTYPSRMHCPACGAGSASWSPGYGRCSWCSWSCMGDIGGERTGRCVRTSLSSVLPARALSVPGSAKLSSGADCAMISAPSLDRSVAPKLVSASLSVSACCCCCRCNSAVAWNAGGEAASAPAPGGETVAEFFAARRLTGGGLKWRASAGWRTMPCAAVLLELSPASPTGACACVCSGIAAVAVAELGPGCGQGGRVLAGASCPPAAPLYTELLLLLLLRKKESAAVTGGYDDDEEAWESGGGGGGKAEVLGPPVPTPTPTPTPAPAPPSSTLLRSARFRRNSAISAFLFSMVDESPCISASASERMVEDMFFE